MTVLDANILLYAYNADAPQQTAAKNWLTGLLASSELIALPWITIWAFIRISTNPRIWENARSPKDAIAIIAEWLAQPAIILLQAGPRHWDILQSLVLDHQAGGPLLTDAVLAALAIEHGASLASTDHDFSRFPGLRWINPLSP